MKLISISNSTRKEKKMVAKFDDGSATHFGLKGSSTYLDNKDDAKRSAYLKRHKANEQWNNPKTAGSLSKHILWGETTSLQANIKSFKKKFNL